MKFYLDLSLFRANFESEGMLPLKKKYIVNERDEKIAVQLDIKTFNKIEVLLEDYVLAQKMRENDRGDRLDVKEAKVFYSKLKKTSS